MKKFSFKAIELLLEAPENKLYKILSNFLSRHYVSNAIYQKENYICAVGELPVMLVAHMDTVFSEPRYIELFYDSNKDSLVCPGGAGFDDRAGVLAITELIKSGYKPTVLFTRGEEVGGIGASDFLTDFPKPFDNLKFIIELDRQGQDDCVFYNCANKEFEKYINSFGFKTKIGSFSDISVFAESWNVAAVNLSIGYVDEHSTYERLITSWYYETFEKVINILKESKIANSFDFQPEYGGDFCFKCGTVTTYYDSYPVRIKDNSLHPYCLDCITKDSVHWCRTCGDAYETADGVCPRCKN